MAISAFVSIGLVGLFSVIFLPKLSNLGRTVAGNADEVFENSARFKKTYVDAPITSNERVRPNQGRRSFYESYVDDEIVYDSLNGNNNRSDKERHDKILSVGANTALVGGLLSTDKGKKFLLLALCVVGGIFTYKIVKKHKR